MIRKITSHTLAKHSDAAHLLVISIIKRPRQRDGKPEDSLDCIAKTVTQNVPTIELTESKEIKQTSRSRYCI